jgi:hypothetical protein
VPWTFAVYREGELLHCATQLWEQDVTGKTSIYYEPPRGYTRGIYEMRIFVAERLQGVAQFQIR